MKLKLDNHEKLVNLVKIKVQIKLKTKMKILNRTYQSLKFISVVPKDLLKKQSCVG